MNNIVNSGDLAKIVRQRRCNLALSQAQLAAQVGVSRQWIIDIEKGKPRAELELTLTLLQALGLQLQLKELNPESAVFKTKEEATAGEAKIQALAEAFNFLNK